MKVLRELIAGAAAGEVGAEELQALARQPGPDSLAAVNEVYGALERVLLSHFFYEETQIGDAVGYYGIGE
ncbi:MAG: hypothetical protein WEB63_04605 [Cucumibacter sp.]